MSSPDPGQFASIKQQSAFARHLSTIFRKPTLSLALLAMTAALPAPGYATPVSSTTRNVPGTYATIQAAITASVSGDTVLVADGTYTGSGNYDLDFAGKNITVRSVNGAATTTINCAGSSTSPHKGFYIHTGETAAVIQGFTITNGYDANLAGGIAISAATASVQQCVIQNCTGRSGGGIYISSQATSPFTASNVTVTDTVIKSNTAFQGGGMFSNASNLTVTRCDFLSNTSTSSTSPTQSYGGGMEITKNNSNIITATVSSCVFKSNSSGAAEGGAIDMASNNSNQTVKVYNCSFYGNNATTTNNGTIDFFNGTNTVRNCIFYGDISSKEISTASPPAAGVVQYCDVNQTGYAGVNGNINSDPKYVSAATGNLKLQAGSPCIGVGTSTGAPSSDRDGVTWASPISMGAYNASAVLPATHYSVSAPGTATAGSPFSATITALDSTNATATAYSGTVHFTTTDGAAVLHADTTLSNGVGTLSFTYRTTGSQTLTATDTVSSSITGTSGSTTVSAGAASQFVVSAPSSATAGSAFNVTVTAKDQYGNVATGYTGTVHFSSTDGAAGLPSDATLTNGAGTFSVTLKTAGSQTVTATDTVTSGLTATTGTITVNAGAVSQLIVNAPSSATAGSAFNVTITAKDGYNNTAAGYTGTVHFSSTDSQAGLPSDATLTNGAGTFSVTLKTAGAQTVTATDTASPSVTGTSGTVAVDPAAASVLEVSGPAAVSAGTPLSVTVTAKDAYGNTATGYAGTVHITSTDGQAGLPADAALVSGTSTFSVTVKTAGSQTVTATDTVTSSLTASTAISVDAGAASQLVVDAASSATAGTAFNVAVTAMDQYGNTVTGYTGAVHFTSTDDAAVLPSDATLTNGVGVFSVTLKTAGGQTVAATDMVSSSITGTSGTITVDPAAASLLDVSAPSAASAGASFSVTVTAKDAYNNTAAGYAGTVHITSTDGTAVLPADAALVNGANTFSVTLRTGGSQTITATDTVDSSLAGNAAVLIGTAPANLTATPGNAQVALAWDASIGATSYNVKRATVDGGPYTVVGSAPANSYSDTGLSNGTVYYYVVSAVNGGFESADSSQASAAPVAPPSASTGLVAVPGNTQVLLSWNAASGATGYIVKRSPVSGGPYTAVAAASSNSYTDAGLTNGVAYYYVVAGINAGGAAPDSAQAGAAPGIVPVAPTGLTATPGNGQAALSWNPAFNAVGYRVRRSTVSGGPYSTVASVTGTSWISAGLTNGVTYYYVVAGFNAFGDGPNSAQAGAALDSHPTAPTGLTATPGNGKVGLSWNPVSGAIGYRIRRSTSPSGPFSTIASVSRVGWTNNGLGNGTTYYYVVAAMSANGDGPNSSQAGATPN